jgi:hypothetical protein
MEKDAYRVNEFCEKYSISRTAFYREIWADRLRIFKCGRSTRVARLDAEQWLELMRQSKLVK